MEKKNSRVLIVDDDEDVLLAARMLLKPYASYISTEKNPALLPNYLRDDSYDVIFLDMNFSKDTTGGQEGFYWLKEIMKAEPSAVVILITAYGDVEKAVRAIKEGATDFILKPWQNEKFLATYLSAMKLRQSRLELEKLKEQQVQLRRDSNKPLNDLVGISPAMEKVFSAILKVAKTEADVLILGENGTGKELVARAIHNNSLRSQEAFVSVDLGSIAPTLFESELFGHVKGAFTNAFEDKPGRFEIASGGTLFLDEIGNIPPELQAKLLTVLQSRQVAKVGSGKYKPVDIRLICATNMPVYEMAEEKKFRQDLLYRINTVEIHVPPLRERKEDIPLLSEYFLSIYGRKYHKPELCFDKTVFRMFDNYIWPGNVRELQHAVERAAIMCESEIIVPSDFFFNSKETQSDEAAESATLDEMEKMTIKKILIKHNGNISLAAKELGLTRTSLYRRIDKYGL
ncbi:MAG: sigma-54-dependent Fis family transcriptional regulator [Ignavibacteria bacterium]|jgi:DNA-binding NtrC family response regulator|nr:sigma-54-dependent Fis family transcriptional regulator [Ignavibacteria bacterium]MCU7501153.1 sigma-54-dependent Fis family transcriptional regulator [Ignavibacteria bacterium]MCU7522220.1 sigma-54-dependent Fis family transcriptional regulator [Ignavibacteria bacterium]MCU7526509.1 sigma-54-dependent Fis family transcriptional regulator [Ignavibacteria bacterium]